MSSLRLPDIEGMDIAIFDPVWNESRIFSCVNLNFSRAFNLVRKDAENYLNCFKCMVFVSFVEKHKLLSKIPLRDQAVSGMWWLCDIPVNQPLLSNVLLWCLEHSSYEYMVLASIDHVHVHVFE